MSHYDKWQSAKKERAEVLAWIANKNKIDSQSGGTYSLLVSSQCLKIDYCGQAYAGAKNYHECPEKMRKVLSYLITKNFESLEKEAIALIDEEIKNLGESARDDVKKMLGEIDA